MKKNVVALLIFIISFFGYAKENLVLYDKIVAIVNNRPILMSEVELAKKWFNIKSDKDALEKLIDHILLYQEAKKRGIKVSPQEVQDAILRIAHKNGINSLDEFKKILINQNLSYTEFYDLIKREIAINKYIQFILKPKILENSKEAVEERFRRVRVIYLNKKNPDFQRTYKFLKEKLNRKNFSEFAKLYSDDKITAQDGGLLGDVKQGELVDFLDKAIWNTKVGTIKEIDTKNGVYFILVEKEFKKLIPKEINNKEILRKLNNEIEILLRKLREKAVIKYLN